MGNVMGTIASLVGQRHQELQESERIQEAEERENITELEEIMNICIPTPSEVHQNVYSNLNINSSGEAPEGKEDKIINLEVKELLCKASMIYNAVAETPGDFAHQNETKNNQNRYRKHKYSN